MSHEAQIAIAKAAAIGSFIISDGAALVLEKLRKELDAGDGRTRMRKWRISTMPSRTPFPRYAQKPRRNCMLNEEAWTDRPDFSASWTTNGRLCAWAAVLFNLHEDSD